MLSTEGRVVGLCWEEQKPKGPGGFEYENSWSKGGTIDFFLKTGKMLSENSRSFGIQGFEVASSRKVLNASVLYAHERRGTGCGDLYQVGL